jgi:hypothetical protein
MGPDEPANSRVIRADHKRLSEPLWKQWPPYAVVGILIAIAAAGVWSASSETLVTAKPRYHLTSWIYLGLAVSFATLFLIVGKEFTSRWTGVLVDPVKNRMSLSQLQTFLWTVLFVSSWTTAVFINFSKNNANNNTAIDPLAVAVPGELVVLMGITVGGLVLSKLVINEKAKQGTQEEDEEATEQGTQEEDEEATEQGRQEEHEDKRVKEGKDPTRMILQAKSPQWRDLFQGDTVRAAGKLDIGKVQLFYITVALLIGYGLVVADSFANTPATGITSLPTFNEAFVILLGISHAGYLTVKAAE